MGKKRLNEIVIFDQFLLEECKNDGKVKLAILKIHLKENKQKAYEFEKEDLEKLIKKKESRVRQKNWKKILLRGALYSSGLSWLTWK